jgi:undecaprenyl-diphosphatase
MDWLEAIVLGVIQGVTEFLPISSSAHLRVVPELFGWKDPGAAFTAVTHGGSALAIILYFAKDILRITDAWLHSLVHRDALRQDALVPISASGSATHRRDRSWDPADARLGWYVIIGTVPIVIAGVLLEDYVENEFRSLWIVAATFIVIGIVLWLADRYGSRSLSLHSLNVRFAIIIGLAQILSLIPGTSRAGVVIAAALLLGLQRDAAARFALLLAIPSVVGATVFEWSDAMGEEATYATGPTMAAVVAAFLSSYATISWLLSWLQTRTFAPFVLYRVGVGVVLIVLLTTGVLSAT